jgi:mercuric ion binding protein
MSYVKKSFPVLFAILALAVSVPSSEAALFADKTATVVEVSEMCGGCVKKITQRFEKVTDVASIKCDIPSKSVTITPKASVTLSPKTLWEIMDEIGKTPVKLAGPSGTFTAKPTK